jgi:hypothetical protein
MRPETDSIARSPRPWSRSIKPIHGFAALLMPALLHLKLGAIRADDALRRADDRRQAVA